MQLRIFEIFGGEFSSEIVYVDIGGGGGSCVINVIKDFRDI